MTDWFIECTDVVPQERGAGPALLFRLRVSNLSGQRVHAMVLRAQIAIEPQLRRYTPEEADLLVDVFGERSEWNRTLTPFEFGRASAVVPSFDGSIEVELPVPVSYDMEVTTGRYLHALAGEPVPMMLRFTGTVFGVAERGLWVEPVPWRTQARTDVPAALWSEVMDAYYPGSGWLRLNRDTLDELIRFKSARGLDTWDEVMGDLVAGASAADIDAELEIGIEESLEPGHAPLAGGGEREVSP